MTTLHQSFVQEAIERAETLGADLGLRNFDLPLIAQALIDAYEAGRTDGRQLLADSHVIG